ncbi:tRNA (cytidine(56)-2'-O)-methyltransferase [Candidatus Micrarchaeota archaeon]|nr:tRNA (cytidine(56)-2'-O)-methyltransferase [Candidatus Micrarchaeota archaeon]
MIAVLRLGHRIGRDVRITTHICLAARALGADKVFLSGEKDEAVIKSIDGVVKRWGGKFEVEYRKDWRAVMKGWKGKTVHLTMYGERLNDKLGVLRKERDLLVIVGAEKVPSEVYRNADFNISVSGQPHSEVAALAVFLDRLFEGKELEKGFPGAKLRVVPQAHGKLTEEKD